MKLFKLFNTYILKNKTLPSKEFLYKTFYERKKFPYQGLSKKTINSRGSKDAITLKDLELEFLENLIDNYPSGNINTLTDIKDFTLECLIPEKLYTVRCTGVGHGNVGLVHIEDRNINLYYSNTYLFERGINYPKEVKLDRIEIKKEILSLFN